MLITAVPAGSAENENATERIVSIQSWLALAHVSGDRRLSETPSAQHRKEDVMKSQKATKSKSNPPGVRLGLSAPADLQPEVQKLQLAIAVRAHELFEARGKEHGHDLDDWLRAKSELLCPVSIAMSESKDRVRVRANVAGFDQNEIEVSVEPGRITILGRK